MTPQECVNSSHQLWQRERFDDVVIGASGKPLYVVWLFRSRRQHQDEHSQGALEHSPSRAQLDSRGIKKHPIQDYQVGHLLADKASAAVPVVTCLTSKPCEGTLYSSTSLSRHQAQAFDDCSCGTELPLWI